MLIGKITARSDGETMTVSAEVDGVPVWFSSADANLAPSAEAFASAFLIPALVAGEDLTLEDPLDPIWASSVPRICRLLEEWWGYAPRGVLAPVAASAEITAPGRAQCFTAGVDSFYSLLEEKPAPDTILFVRGFDIPLEDQARLDAHTASLRKIAAETDARAVFISSNLRYHPAVGKVDWGRCHGGALAGVGHLLSRDIGSLLIPASYPMKYGPAWGSHWDLDPLWSSSGLKVEHGDASLARVGKLPAICAHPLVERHLTVCWENRTATGNCSRCEKCVRTMLTLEICGGLSRSQTFDLTIPLPRLIASIGAVDHELVRIYENLRPEIRDPEIGDAVDRLIRRSHSRVKGPVLRYLYRRRAAALKPRWRAVS